MPRMKKRITSSKKKRKKKSTAPSHQPVPITDLPQILSQAEIAHETSDLESSLQWYQYAQKSLQQKIQEQEGQQSSISVVEENVVADIITLSKVLCKIGEIKVSFQNPSDDGFNDFSSGIQLLSNDNESKYLSLECPSSERLIIKAQWKEARANLFMYMGQMSSEKDALSNFNNSILDLKQCQNTLEEAYQLMMSQNDPVRVEKTNEIKNVQAFIIEICRQLCGAYCSISELYLTDLCYEPNAEQECENALKLALELDNKINEDIKSMNNVGDDSNKIAISPDALQAMANLRLCQSRFIDAIPFILNAYSRMKVGCEAMALLVGLGRDNETKPILNGQDDTNVATELKEDALKETNKLPGFEFRCQTAKILLECATKLAESIQCKDTMIDNCEQTDLQKQEEQLTHCIEAGIQTLGSLMAENDEVIETWYLIGCAFQAKSSSHDIDIAKHYFETALEMLIKTKEQLEQSSDAEMVSENDEFNPLQDVLEKIEDVKGKMKEIEQNHTFGAMDED